MIYVDDSLISAEGTMQLLGSLVRQVGMAALAAGLVLLVTYAAMTTGSQMAGASGQGAQGCCCCTGGGFACGAKRRPLDPLEEL
jgi:hypothetical protein